MVFECKRQGPVNFLTRENKEKMTVPIFQETLLLSQAGI